MTDEETITRLRASEMPPGKFLDALESLETTQEIPHPGLAECRHELACVRDDRDVWRFSCVASWAMWALTLLAASTWGIA